MAVDSASPTSRSSESRDVEEASIDSTPYKGSDTKHDSWSEASVDVQEGVKKIEAVTSSWSTKTLIVTYVVYVLTLLRLRHLRTLRQLVDRLLQQVVGQ